MINVYKKIIVSLITVVITVTATYGGYTIYAASEPETSYYGFTKILKFEVAKLQYNVLMSTYFDDKFENLLKLIEEDKKFYDHKDFNTPKDVNIDNYKEKCTVKNVSTYCTAMGAMDMYLAYIETMTLIKAKLPIVQPGQNAKSLLIENSAKNEAIDIELEMAKRAMEATIATYEEFRSAYPMHKQYEKVIKNLKKYKIALKKIREEVEEFPGRFIDSTSVECE